MNGMSQEKFAPNGILTRGQLVTILHRLAGSPTPTGASPFTDVKEGRYYAEAVSWAAEQGLAQGVTETRFVPEAPATREQLVTFLCRYAAMHGVDTAAGGSLSNFPDASSVSSMPSSPCCGRCRLVSCKVWTGAWPQSLRNPRTDRCVP